MSNWKVIPPNVIGESFGDERFIFQTEAIAFENSAGPIEGEELKDIQLNVILQIMPENKAAFFAFIDLPNGDRPSKFRDTRFANGWKKGRGTYQQSIYRVDDNKVKSCYWTIQLVGYKGEFYRAGVTTEHMNEGKGEELFGDLRYGNLFSLRFGSFRDDGSTKNITFMKFDISGLEELIQKIMVS